MTDEQHLIQTRLLNCGVKLVTGHTLERFDGTSATLTCIHTGRGQTLTCESLLLVTMRTPNDALYHQLVKQGGGRNISRIGDCHVPGAIVHAIYAGHRFARELDTPSQPDASLRRERVIV